MSVGSCCFSSRRRHTRCALVTEFRRVLFRSLIPRVILMLLPVFTNFDWRQVQAAQSLGAGYGRAVIGILGPQVLPSVLAAFCLVMAVAIGDRTSVVWG